MNTNEFRIEDLILMNADATFDDDYCLKLTSKKLKSGKCQVKFYATVQDYRELYGYVLVDAEKTLKDVVTDIKEKLHTIRLTREFHHLHLYSIGKDGRETTDFIIFDR